MINKKYPTRKSIIKKIKKLNKRQIFVLVAILSLIVATAFLYITNLSSTIPVEERGTAVVEPDKISEPEPGVKVEDPDTTDQTNQQPPIVDDDAVEPSQWPVLLSNSQASSLTVVVNKKHKLPSNYVPTLQAVAGGQMRPEAASALGTLLQDASNAGKSMRIISSYRSYQTQVNTYNKWVAQDGVAAADRYSARAGHSEHQTGLGVDFGNSSAVCDLEICFGDTPEGQWLAQNAHLYGFIIRYQSNAEAITGYQYEPWHLRYVGVDVASLVKNANTTLDQYYNVEAGGY